jgi:hypothetical protein
MTHVGRGRHNSMPVSAPRHSECAAGARLAAGGYPRGPSGEVRSDGSLGC